MAKFELVVENGAPLSFMEMREIVSIIDDHIAEELGVRYRRRRPFLPPFFFDEDLARYDDDFSFVEIESAKSGSIILTLAITGIAVWGLGAFASGLRRSRLGGELSRLGENAGNILSDGLDVVNSRLEDWSDANRRLRERKTRVTIRRLSPDEHR